MVAYRLSVVDSASRKRRRTCHTTSDTTRGRSLCKQTDALRGLETPAMTVKTAVEGCDLARVDALCHPSKRGADARVTASNSPRDTPGEGHLRPDRDQ